MKDTFKLIISYLFLIRIKINYKIWIFENIATPVTATCAAKLDVGNYASNLFLKLVAPPLQLPIVMPISIGCGDHAKQALSNIKDPFHCQHLTWQWQWVQSFFLKIHL